MKTAARVFLVDDDELIVTTLSRILRSEGYDVRAVTSARNVLKEVRSWSPSIVLLDIRLPDRSGLDVLQELMKSGLHTQVVMLTADDTAETAVKAMKLGAVDYFTKPFNVDEVKIVLKNIVEKEQLQLELDYLRKVSEAMFEQEIVSVSAAMNHLKKEIKKMAAARISRMLITGESGVGKEVFARYLHRLRYGDAGPRRVPLLAVNCAAVPEQLLESELFGHERGAFTDAKTEKKGIFELASGGTILLDEIGEMQPNLQAKLLRVLEERTVRRIGGNADIPVNVTVIATTNKNLAKAIETESFRKDLFFRLSNFYLHVPPLRERKEDIPVLAAHFISYFSKQYNKKSIERFSETAEELLKSYHWPGNVRELKNLVERLVVLESAEDIQPEHLPSWLTCQTVTTTDRSANGLILPEGGISIDELERDLIRQALERTKRNKAQAARLLHMSYDTLRYQVKKFGLE